MLLFAKMLRVGMATVPLRPPPGQVDVLHLVREVDAGSCNGCAIEITGLMSPVYDSERFGIHSTSPIRETISDRGVYWTP